MDNIMNDIMDNFMDNGFSDKKMVGKHNIKRLICQQKLKNAPYMHFPRLFVGGLEEND